MTVLSLRSVTFRYPASQTPALRDVTLEVSRGEVLALIGSVGAGASTLLLVAGALAPRVTGGELGGTVERAGRAALLLPTPWTQLSGMAFSVFDEVAFGPANLGWPRERISASVERALTRVEVAHLRDRDPATLSGGELQRVLLAGILAMEPDVLLLDEPTAELDPLAARRIWELTRVLAREGMAVVVATNDLDALPDTADRVAWLEEGAVRALGPAREVLVDPALSAEDAPGSTSIAAVWRAAGLAEPPPLTVRQAVERMR
jgi:energy-coupling factor transporter ATP-binding protein EcfA2